MPKHIHLIGICGTGIGSLAGLLVEAGYKVSGSDTNFYPPMSDQLKALPIDLKTGFDPKNLHPKPDAVVIGNVCTKENPEAKAVLEKNIPYFSLPQALQDFFLKDKKALVVTGTHGKTTTSHLLAWVLTSAKKDPGFMIGGVGLNSGKSFHLGKGDFFVAEGDEYDSAFFDKGPKFAHYHPFGGILTSIELDHVDIYPTLEKIVQAFEKFIATFSSSSVLLTTTQHKTDKFTLKKYGVSEGDYHATDIKPIPAGTSFTLVHPEGKVALFLPLSGKANLENAIAVAGLCHEIGLPWEEIEKGFKTFLGIKKRQEIKGVVKEVTVIDDFAHHPTAVKKTIQALKEKFPGQRLIVVFEPRSNTSRRNTHYQEYCQAFDEADRVIIAPLYHPEKIAPGERLNTEKLADDLMKRGIDAYAIDNYEAILEFVVRSIGPKEVVAFFSNGDFGNIHEKLLEKLGRRKIFSDRKESRPIKIKTP